MENEKRLIDANAFIEALKNADADVCEEYPDCDCDWGFSRKVIVDLLKNIPTVDAVEVVRCKDCEYWLNYGVCDLHTEVNAVWMDADDFCSKGERKGGE